MKIPETLSTKSVAIGFLGFLILIGIVLGCIFMAGHERKGDKEGRNSRNEMMEGNGHRDRFEGRDSEKNNNDEDSENRDQENVQPVSKQESVTSQALSGSTSSGVSLTGSTTPSSTLIGTGGNQSSKK